MLTNFDFLYDDEAEDVSWGPEYEDRRLSYCSLDVGSLDRDMKANLQTLECLSGSEQDLTPHDSSDDEDEVLGHFLFVHTSSISSIQRESKRKRRLQLVRTKTNYNKRIEIAGFVMVNIRVSTP